MNVRDTITGLFVRGIEAARRPATATTVERGGRQMVPEVAELVAAADGLLAQRGFIDRRGEASVKMRDIHRLERAVRAVRRA